MIGIVALGGPPASGKSAAMRTYLKQLQGQRVEMKDGLLAGWAYTQEKIFVLGSYGSTEKYPGTDRLSMAVQPHFTRVVKAWAVDPARQGWIILFEGDRLFNDKSLELALEYPHRFLVLSVLPELVKIRHTARDNQDEKWLQGRVTKVNNLVAKYQILSMNNNESPDLLNIALTLQVFVRAVRDEVAALREVPNV